MVELGCAGVRNEIDRGQSIRDIVVREQDLRALGGISTRPRRSLHDPDNLDAACGGCPSNCMVRSTGVMFIANNDAIGTLERPHAGHGRQLVWIGACAGSAVQRCDRGARSE